MGLFDRFKQPKWVRMMPPALRPSAEQIAALEAIRQKVGASHVEFEMHITGHSATTRRLLLTQCQTLQQQRPDVPLQAILAAVLMQRFATGGHALGINDALGPEGALRLARTAVSRFNGAEEFVEAVIRDEAMFGEVIPGEPAHQSATDEISRILGDRR